MKHERLLTPEQVAERLQISRLTVMEYLRDGKLIGRKVGRLWRITEEDLATFLRPTMRLVKDAPAAEDASLGAINEALEATDRQ